MQLRARLRASFAEHEIVITAIEAGDAEAAAEVMRGNVTVQGERFAHVPASLERREVKSA